MPPSPPRPDFRSAAFWRASLAYALRVSVTAVLALYAAMWLQLDVPRWAMWTVIVITPPSPGDVIRKAAARLIGTPIGCAAAVAIAGLFPQDRVGYVLALSAWIGGCGFVATRRQGYVAYGALLAGFTAAIVGAATASDPQRIFFTALDRGSATTVGVLFATFSSALTSQSDDVPAVLAGRVCAVAGPLLEWASDRLAPGAVAADDLPFASPLLLLDTAVVNAYAERPSLRNVGPWVGGLPTALLSLQSSAMELGRRATDADAAAAAAVRPSLDRCLELLRAGAKVPVVQLRAESDRLAECRPTVPAAAELVDAVAYLLAGLEAILTIRPPVRSVRPFPPVRFAPERSKSWAAFFRVTVGTVLGFIIWDVTAWPFGTTLLVNVAVALIITLSADDPLAGLRGFLTGTIVGNVVGIAAVFLLLPLGDGFGWLAVVLVPLLAISPWLLTTGLPPALSLAYGNAIVGAIDPTNPQVYSLAPSIETAVATVIGAVIARYLFIVIDPGGHGPARVRHKLHTLRWRLETARRTGPVGHDARMRWETQAYDEVRRLQASGGDRLARRAAAHSLLAGRAALRPRSAVDVRVPEDPRVPVPAP